MYSARGREFAQKNGAMKRIIFSLTVCVVAMLCLPTSTGAQETDGRLDLQTLTEQVSAEFDQAVADIEADKEDIKRVEERLSGLEGMAAEILTARRDRQWTAMFHKTLDLAREVAAQESTGKDVSAYRDYLVSELGDLPGETYVTLMRLRGRVKFPTPDLPPEKFVIADQKLFKQLREVDEVFRALISYVQIADRFGLDASVEKAYMDRELADSAANRSIFLEIALDDVAMLRSSIATLPENENLADWMSAAQTRIEMTAKAMQSLIGLMNTLGLETRHYRQQVLTATGEITTDVLDVGIVASLVSQWGKTSAGLLTSEGPRVIFRLLLVMFILFAFFQFAKLVQKGVDRALGSARVSISSLLHRMIVSSVRNLIVLFGILIAISQLGVSLGPLLAGLGIAGFIIGFALQDSLSNFASGMMILMYRPFDVGDVVEAGGVKGRVNKMSLVNTTFLTLDNQRLIVPNNLIWQSVITNVTAQRTRRIDLMFGISYEDDVEKAERVLLEIVESHEAVLDDPEPVIKLHELGDSSVNFIVRPWVKTGVYWETYWDLTKAVKLRFDEEGISIPFPQRDVHVIEHKT
jgi:small conductance mechanosensitive channel